MSEKTKTIERMRKDARKIKVKGPLGQDSLLFLAEDVGRIL